MNISDRIGNKYIKISLGIADITAKKKTEREQIDEYFERSRYDEIIKNICILSLKHRYGLLEKIARDKNKG